MRGNSHVRFGGRAEETDRPKGRHRASVRPNQQLTTVASPDQFEYGLEHLIHALRPHG